jgi:hypothetical protein
MNNGAVTELVRGFTIIPVTIVRGFCCVASCGLCCRPAKRKAVDDNDDDNDKKQSSKSKKSKKGESVKKEMKDNDDSDSNDEEELLDKKAKKKAQVVASTKSSSGWCRKSKPTVTSTSTADGSAVQQPIKIRVKIDDGEFFHQLLLPLHSKTKGSLNRLHKLILAKAGNPNDPFDAYPKVSHICFLFIVSLGRSVDEYKISQLLLLPDTLVSDDSVRLNDRQLELSTLKLLIPLFYVGCHNTGGRYHFACTHHKEASNYQHQ